MIDDDINEDPSLTLLQKSNSFAQKSERRY